MALLRLANLGVGAIELARAVALLGDGAVLTTAGALAGLSEQQVVAAAAALTAADILADDPELSFVHPLVRSVVYEDIAPAARAVWHRRAARLLAVRGAPVGIVAAQLLLAERTGDPWAVARLLDGAGAAPRRSLVSWPSARWRSLHRLECAPACCVSLRWLSSTSAG